jgi:hypothetical protein
VIDLMQALKQSLGAAPAEKEGCQKGKSRYGDKETKESILTAKLLKNVFSWRGTI